MEPVAKIIVKKRRLSQDNACLLCHDDLQEQFVLNPSDNACHVLLESLTKLILCNHEGAIAAVDKIGVVHTAEQLKALGVRWHLSCYKKFTHRKTLQVAEKRHRDSHSIVEGDSCSDIDIGNVQEANDTATNSAHFTRTYAPVYEKTLCFFCDAPSKWNDSLRHVSYSSSGDLLRRAVELSGNDIWRVRLSENITPGDAHAMDVLYHRNCWTLNVRDALRKQRLSTETLSKSTLSVASEVEFLRMVKEFLDDGNVTCMADLHSTYVNIYSSNGVDVDTCKVHSRKELKQLLLEAIPGIVFSPAKQKNASERVALSCTRDVAMWKLEDDSEEEQWSTLLKAAMIIRNICQLSDAWKFNGCLNSKTYDIPEKLQLFYKWCLVGKATMSTNKRRGIEVDERSKRLSQMLMYECLSPRQAAYEGGDLTRRRKELPLQVGVGLTVHKLTRSAKLVTFMSQLGISVNYDRVKDIENEIGQAVMKRVETHDGIYVPPELKSNRFTHFAADNLDFHEDTPDGKHTLHGTVMVAFQAVDEGETVENITLDNSDPVPAIPDMIYTLLSCSIKKDSKPLYRDSQNGITDVITPSVFAEAVAMDYAWLIVRKRCLELYENDTQSHCGLTWAGHNCLLVPHSPRKTVVAVFPILNRSPTDRCVQLTVNRQFQAVKKILNAPGIKTVITVDLGLYRPMQQLQMTMKESDCIYMPGDLHVIMAQLRGIGSFIDASGIPELWSASGIYSDQVVKGILEGKPVRRSIEAHTVTLQVMFKLLCDEFVAHSGGVIPECEESVQKVINAWNDSNYCAVPTVHTELKENLRRLDFTDKLDSFCMKMCAERPTFALARQYVSMVLSMLAFIRSVRSSNWDLRLTALNDFAKYFFALDLRNYASMTALHLADMACLKAEDPATWNYLLEGLWSPNKNQRSFCSLGADETLEQENRKLKVMGGVKGITLKQETLNRFFLTAPYLSRMAEDVTEMLHLNNKATSKHHHLRKSSSSRQMRYAKSLHMSCQDYTNPFQYDGHDLVNLVTKRVAIPIICQDVCRMSAVGDERYSDFVQKRLTDRSLSVWDTLPGVKLQLCKNSRKKATVKTKMGVVEIKQDQHLFTRCLLICKSRPDMDLKTVIGHYELSIVPRSLFYADGSLIHLQGKSQIMHHLIDLIAQTDSDKIPPVLSDQGINEDSSGNVFSVAVVDAMAEVQMLTLSLASNIADLAALFCQKMLAKYRKYRELHMVFDTYQLHSLKAGERERRQRGNDPIRFKITANTQLKSVKLSVLLSHVETKNELTEFFSNALFHSCRESGRHIIASYRQEILSTCEHMDDLRSSHEEADTKMLLHAVHAAKRGAQKIRIFSPDTDVLVLAVRRSPLLPEDTGFVSIGRSKHEINLQAVYRALGPSRSAALPGLHALSGADITGSFSGKGKTTFWTKFLIAPQDELEALSHMGEFASMPEETFTAIEKFICSIYTQRNFTTLSSLRWWMYSKKQTEGSGLPPTSAALRPAVRRCHFQCMEWYRDCIPHPDLPPPTDYGWLQHNDKYEPLVCDLPCAPEEVLQFVKCSCTKGRCTPPCKCASQKPPLPCTEMCDCGVDEGRCDNSVTADAGDEDESDIDEQNSSDSDD